VMMSLSMERSRPRLAVAAMRRKQASLVKALDKAGIPSNSVRVSYLSLHPVYAPHPASHVVVAYTASMDITVSLDKFELVGEVMESGAAAGVKNVRTSFRNTELPKLKERVRAMALEAGTKKAEQLVAGVGAKLGDVKSVSENQAGAGWRFNNNISNALEVNSAPLMTLTPTLQPLTLTVTIGYEILQSEKS